MTQPLPDDSYDYSLAKTRNTSEALRLMVGGISELQKLYDDLGYAIHSELTAGGVLDKIKRRIETGEPVAEPLDELEDTMRRWWSHFTCEGYCLGDSFPELSDAEKKGFVQANPWPITEEQWHWHRNDDDLFLGLTIDKLRNGAGDNTEGGLKMLG